MEKEHTKNMSRIITWIGDVTFERTDKTLEKIRELMGKDPKKQIDMYVMCLGGAACYAHGFYDTIRLLKPNLVTIAAGNISSAGVLIWLVGTQRYITRHTTCLFHQVAKRYEDEAMTETDIGTEKALLKSERRNYNDIVASESCGSLGKKQVFEMCRHQRVFGPRDLLKHGLAHKII
ncbi:MAG: ATP-dependent Clp protease proteolytic subunit [Candidatus Taylorbacteria bacterium]|nr:ATP-dependent Clp protease proteolytic subunit [Candidatus Taylorbacteria bacterium]